MEKYIARAIKNVLAQKVNFAYEIIVAGDCSTDNTIKFCKNISINRVLFDNFAYGNK